MTVAHTPQVPLFLEKTLDDAALERQLLERHRMQEQLREYRKKFGEVDDAVKGRITELRIRGTVRCGGFVITVQDAASREVEFSTKPHKRITIRPVKAGTETAAASTNPDLNEVEAGG
jgi:hypothetical protein